MCKINDKKSSLRIMQTLRCIYSVFVSLIFWSINFGASAVRVVMKVLDIAGESVSQASTALVL